MKIIIILSLFSLCFVIGSCKKSTCDSATEVPPTKCEGSKPNEVEVLREGSAEVADGSEPEVVEEEPVQETKTEVEPKAQATGENRRKREAAVEEAPVEIEPEQKTKSDGSKAAKNKKTDKKGTKKAENVVAEKTKSKKGSKSAKNEAPQKGAEVESQQAEEKSTTGQEKPKKSGKGRKHNEKQGKNEKLAKNKNKKSNKNKQEKKSKQ